MTARLWLLDLGYRVGELVQVGAEGVQESDDRAPARVAPPTLDVGHVRLARRYACSEHLLSDAGAFSEYSYCSSEGMRVVVGARNHRERDL